ncbi:MAG TPA: MauE/DoxX family redox-associated membrane protein [Acidimicrobiia bacterium]
MTADDVAVAARVVVAIILVASGVGKLLGVRQSIRQYRVQFGGYAWITVLVALALPLYELVLAALLLFVDATWPSWLALATFAVFTVVLLRRIVINDRSPCNCFGAASTKRDLGIGSLLRNTWFLVLALIATGATTMAEPTAMLGTVLLGCGFLAVSAVLVVRT